MFIVGLFFILLWLIFFICLDLFIPKSKQHLVSRRTIIGEINVVIAIRNEANNIINCLNCLNDQEGLEAYKLRVIIVDDYSTDHTIKLISENESIFKNLDISVLENKGEGKKDALLTAIPHILAPIVYLTDADCFLELNCLSRLQNRLVSEKLAAALGMVKLKGASFFDELLAFENLNNMAVTESFIQRSNPLLANGGNLMFRKEHLEMYRSSLQNSNASGDDVFFLEKLLENDEPVGFEKDAVVFTKSADSIYSFVEQRVRWAGKSKAYNSMQGRLLPVFIWIVNAVFLATLLSCLISGSLLSGAILFFLKWVIEFLFQSSWFRRYDESFPISRSFLLSFLYPFYVTFVGIRVMVNPTFSWKDRTYKNGLRNATNKNEK